MEKVSLIVPVYNVENYVCKCIESILEQTYTNIEILLIDDGSIDESGKICDEYARIDSKIKVFHITNNGGVSNARNFGIERAQGSYLMFVDADDFMEKEMVEKMIANIKDSEMVICGYWEVFKNVNKKHSVIKNENFINSENAINRTFERDSYGGYLWNKLFITSIVKENNIQFESNIHMCEDLLFVIKYMIHCKKINVIPECLYYYRMRKSSMVWNKNDNKFQSLFISYNMIYEILEKERIQMTRYYYSLLTNIFLNKKFLKKYKRKNNLTLRLYKIYLSELFSKEIPIKRKFKLVILKRFRFIYDIYMKMKITKLEQFD